MSSRTISVSKDKSRQRVYKQYTHEGCANIAKKFDRCYRHGAPRKMCMIQDCSSNAQTHGLCRMHFRAEKLTHIPVHVEGEGYQCVQAHIDAPVEFNKNKDGADWGLCVNDILDIE